MAEIGSTMREARMRARIDISEVEARTKIRAKYLRALENEEWDLLPGPVYVKSFLKTYGDFLGLDSRLLVDEFKRRYERPLDHEVRAVASTARERERQRRRQPSRLSRVLLSPRSVIGLALIVIVVALYVIGSHSGNNNTPAGNSITPSTSTTGDGHHHKSTGGGHGRHSGTTTLGTGTTTTTPAVAKSATLKLVATAPVWICVENQSGKPLFPAGIYSPGQAAIPAVKARTLLVTLGNAHVTMTADGKPYTPTGSSAIGLKITPQGVQPLSPGPNCGQ
jgi:cytoskeletal protein RodZ